MTDQSWQDVKDAFLLAALPHVPFEGWSQKALTEAARDLGRDDGERQTLAARLFPGGPAELVAHFLDYADRQMAADFAAAETETLGVGAKVELALRLRLERWQGEREAVSRAVALLSLPLYAPLVVKCTARTVDAVWRAVGDASVDFNYYTKRATLAAVYSATLLIWLNDTSEDGVETLAFLQRRLADVARIPALKGKIGKWLPDPLKLLTGVKRGRGRWAA